MQAYRASDLSGLNSDSFKVQTAGVHSIYVRTTVNEPSGLVITISQTGSASNSFVSPATSAQQLSVEMNAKFNCAVGDVLTVAVTSSAAIDQPPNLIKSVIVLKQGV